MEGVLQPIIRLSNQLRFKYKFFVIAVIFYLPIVLGGSWIVLNQKSHLDSASNMQEGLIIVERILKLEQKFDNEASAASINSSVTSVQPLLSQNKFSDLSRAINQFKTGVAELDTSETSLSGLAVQNQLSNQLFDLRENAAAASGLIRITEPEPYYMADLAIFRIPELNSYLSRIKNLALFILEDGGFNAESYTRIVGFDKRIDELQSKVEKTLERLSSVSEDKQLISTLESLLAGIDNFQNTLRSQFIEPDSILLSRSQLNSSANDAIENGQAVSAKLVTKLNQKIITKSENAVSVLTLLAAIIALVFIASSIFIYAIYLSLTSNVNKLQQAANGIAQGDLRSELTINTRDELGDIGNAFKQMQLKVSELISHLQNDVEALRTASVEINAKTDEMKDSLNKQKIDTVDVAKAMNQISEAVIDVSANTHLANEVTESANSDVLSGQSVIQQTAQVIDNIAAEVNDSANVIQAVEKETANIAQFVNVIRDIADQTNLLALNAAIEAARAGEQGRGFAVVADEVRALANRTQDTTKEIETIIEQLQSDAKQAVKAMENGVSKAQEGVKQANEVERTFTNVTERVAQIVAINQQIATSVTQQNNMVQEVNENTHNISTQADNVLDSSTSTSQTSSSLYKLAEELQATLNYFKQ